MLVNEILETFDLKPSGLLDKGGNKSFNVIDNNTGKTVKTFTGPNAAGQAEQFRDVKNKELRKAGVKVGDKTVNAPDETKPKAKVKKPGMLKRTANLGGRLVKTVVKQNVYLAPFVLGNAKLVSYADGYINNYIDNNYSDTIQADIEDSDRYVKAMAYYKLQLGKAIVAVFLTSLETIIVAVKGGQAVNKSIAVMKTALLAVPGFGWAAWIFSGIIQLIGAGAMWWAIKVLIDLQTKLQDPKVTRGAAEYFATRFFAPNLIASIAGVPGVTSGRLESIEENRYMVVEEMEVPTDLIKKAKAIFKKKVPKDKWKEIKAR